MTLWIYTHCTYLVNPLIMAVYFTTTVSSQPHRRGLPVVTPYSWPRLRILSPSSCMKEYDEGEWVRERRRGREKEGEGEEGEREERERERERESVWNNYTFFSSVGNSPAPTRVVYALTTPYTVLTSLGGIPSPVHTPPALQLDDVTKGYVPEH